MTEALLLAIPAEDRLQSQVSAFLQANRVIKAGPDFRVEVTPQGETETFKALLDGTLDMAIVSRSAWRDFKEAARLARDPNRVNAFVDAGNDTLLVSRQGNWEGPKGDMGRTLVDRVRQAAAPFRKGFNPDAALILQ